MPRSLLLATDFFENVKFSKFYNVFAPIAKFTVVTRQVEKPPIFTDFDEARIMR
jgi:hypothetical protein